jgi:singapore isolate B (sub-type 7) whole genome shotgun sequence assembly, scaffold_2
LNLEQYETVDEKEIMDLTTEDEPTVSGSTKSTSRQFYKTENDIYFPIPHSSFSFSDYLFQRGLECEIASQKQRTLEVKYWKYMEFYTLVISKIIHLFHSGQIQSPFIVFFHPSIQQMYGIIWYHDVARLFRKLLMFLMPIR